MKPDWLTEHDSNHMDQEKVYLLSEVSEKYKVEELPYGSYLVLNWDKEGSWLSFALLESMGTDLQERETELKLVFHGTGPTDSLRECRHTYWGEEGEGYLFYPNGRIITSAFKRLSQYFDDME